MSANRRILEKRLKKLERKADEGWLSPREWETYNEIQEKLRMGNREWELQQQIERVREAAKASNEAKAALNFQMELLGRNFPEVLSILEEKEAEPALETQEAPTIDELTSQLKQLLKQQAPIEEIKSKSAELQGAING